MSKHPRPLHQLIQGREQVPQLAMKEEVIAYQILDAQVNNYQE